MADYSKMYDYNLSVGPSIRPREHIWTEAECEAIEQALARKRAQYTMLDDDALAAHIPEKLVQHVQVKRRAYGCKVEVGCKESGDERYGKYRYYLKVDGHEEFDLLPGRFFEKLWDI